MTSSAARVRAGVPSGGQFASHDRPEAPLGLGPVGMPDVEPDGSLRWLEDGVLHRTDGPAVIYADGTEVWYYEGEVHRDGDYPAITTSTGDREHYRYGARHRAGDQPAVKYAEGGVEYWVNGVRHRDGGEPAVAKPDGHTEWWVNGKLHRPVGYGPAIILADGGEMYFEHGVEIKGARR